MNRAGRAALSTLAFAVVVGPLLTLHPALIHLSDASLTELWIEASHPQVVGFVTLTVMAALPTAGFLTSLVAAAKSRNGMRALLDGSKPAASGDLLYRVVPSDSVFLFTAGLFRPVVFASSEAVRCLSPDELRAALLHERAHQRNRDVLWGLLLRAVSRSFRPLPQVRQLVRVAALRTECAADDHALRGGAKRRDLFEAIAAASPVPALRTPATGIGEGDAQLRLVRLVRPETPLPQTPTGGFLALTATMTLPAALAHLIALVAAVCGARLS